MFCVWAIFYNIVKTDGPLRHTVRAFVKLTLLLETVLLYQNTPNKLAIFKGIVDQKNAADVLALTWKPISTTEL